MAFPFWWIGALTAGLFLAATFTVFGLALRLMSRTTSEIRGSVLPGLVSGFRDWADMRGPGGQAPRAGAGSGSGSGTLIETTAAIAQVTTERLRRR